MPTIIHGSAMAIIMARDLSLAIMIHVYPSALDGVTMFLYWVEERSLRVDLLVISHGLLP